MRPHPEGRTLMVRDSFVDVSRKPTHRINFHNSIYPLITFQGYDIDSLTLEVNDY